MEQTARTTSATQDGSALRWRRIIRLLWLIPLLSIALAVMAVGVLFLRSDIKSFHPHLPSIRQKVEAQRVATPVPPPFLLRCLNSDCDLTQFIARGLLWEHGLDQTTSLRRHVRAVFWSWSLRWHLSESERNLLLCASVPDGSGLMGIHHLSQKLHGRPVDELNVRQMAELATASGSPMRFLKDRELLRKKCDQLMSSLDAG